MPHMTETASPTVAAHDLLPGSATRQDRQAGQAVVVAALAAVLPRHAILSRHEDTVPYECDGLTAYRASPFVVVRLKYGLTLHNVLKVPPPSCCARVMARPERLKKRSRA